MTNGKGLRFETLDFRNSLGSQFTLSTQLKKKTKQTENKLLLFEVTKLSQYFNVVIVFHFFSIKGFLISMIVFMLSS